MGSFGLIEMRKRHLSRAAMDSLTIGLASPGAKHAGLNLQQRQHSKYIFFKILHNLHPAAKSNLIEHLI